MRQDFLGFILTLSAVAILTLIVILVTKRVHSRKNNVKDLPEQFISKFNVGADKSKCGTLVPTEWQVFFRTEGQKHEILCNIPDETSNDRPFIIGRDSEKCSLVLNSPQVSREHLYISKSTDEEKLYAYPMSKDGRVALTYIKDRKRENITKKYFYIENGLEIWAGDVHLRFNNIYNDPKDGLENKDSEQQSSDEYTKYHI